MHETTKRHHNGVSSKFIPLTSCQACYNVAHALFTATLVLQLLENCLDRHVEENADRPAFIWEKDEPGTHEVVTYGYVFFYACV